MIRELCEYIESNTSFTIGSTLFALGMDSDVVDRCVVMAEVSPGIADPTLDGLRQIPLVAYARAKTQFTARDDAYTVFNLLHRGYQVSLGPVGSGPVYVCNFVCRTPYNLGLDETGRRYVFALPIDVTVTNML